MPNDSSITPEDDLGGTQQTDDYNICPANIGGEPQGPIIIDWQEGLERLESIRNDCAAIRQAAADIRNAAMQIMQTMGMIRQATDCSCDAATEIAEAMPGIDASLRQIAIDTGRLASQIDPPYDRQPQTWEITVDAADWWYEQVLPIAQIVAGIYITDISITLSGTASAIYAQVCTATDEGPPSTITPIRILYPYHASPWDNNMMVCSNGRQTERNNLMIRADTIDYMIAVICKFDIAPDILRLTIRIRYYRDDGLHTPALEKYIY